MKTMKQMQSLQALREVALTRSYSLAAKNLGVSKAHISKTINEYENYLGQSLFERTTRTVKLTYAGETLWQRCLLALDQIDEATNLLRQASDKPRGPLRVSVAGAFGEEHIAPLLSKLAIKYPDLRIDLDFTPRRVNLIEENFDLAIRVGKLDEAVLPAIQIASRQEYICATHAYLKSNPKPILRPQDLREHNCLIGSGTWLFQDKKKSMQIKVNGNFSSNNGHALLNATLANVGISRLPGVYVKNLITKGKLVSLLEDFTPKDVPIWAVSTPHKLMSPNVQSLLKLLQERFEDPNAEVF